MPISLHAALVPTMLQLLGAGKDWLAKAQSSSLSEDEVIGARLVHDMLPFAYQVKSMVVHSQGAFEGVKAGVFTPDMSEPPNTLAGLGERLDQGIAYLSALDEEEIEAMRGGSMRFEMGERQMLFTVDDFLFSFSQPNFHFHSATAYGILRASGIAVGKRDYLGAVRIKS